MQGNHTRTAAALILAASFLAVDAVAAQEAEETPATQEIEACTAVLTPATLTVAETPVQITAVLSQDVGLVGFEAPEESGLTVVAPEDVPMEDMASTEEAPQPITMADEANTFLVWVNTQTAQTGSFDVVLTGENGSCHGTIEVASN